MSPLPVALLATEVFATILGLFFFGSFKYQIHKNALTYGMLLMNRTGNVGDRVRGIRPLRPADNTARRMPPAARPRSVPAAAAC